MFVTFLGSASCRPSPERGVSCTALRLDNGEVFLFDVGEGAQVVLKESSVKMGRITRIFITHLHGDHVFGLPGLLATLSISHESQAQVVHIYGPVGLAAYVRTTLRLTQTFLGISLALYELLPSQLALALEPCNPADPPLMAPESLVQGMEPHASEVEPLKRIACDEDSQCWTLLSTPELKVTAGFLLHKIPSFGYVVKESDAPGRLDAGLAISLGVTPGPDLGRLKNGEAVTTSAGRIVHPTEVVGVPKPGRKLVFLGDSCDTSLIESQCQGADLVVHETTMENAMQDLAFRSGHSTPAMAAKFARDVGARVLAITHFSPRYKPFDWKGESLDSEPESETPQKTRRWSERSSKSDSVLCTETEEALEGSGCRLVVTEDLLEFEVPRRTV